MLNGLLVKEINSVNDIDLIYKNLSIDIKVIINNKYHLLNYIGKKFASNDGKQMTLIANAIKNIFKLLYISALVIDTK